MSAITDFFEELGARGHEPLLERASGTVRVEVTNGKRTAWLVTIEKGDVSVTRRNARADCVVRFPEKLFEGVVKGRMNATAAVLRGEVETEGDPELLVLFQRLFGAQR
jgi:putative sterol carrier protein